MVIRNLDKLIKGDHIVGVNDVIFDKDRLCSACQVGKQVGGSHPVKNIMTTRRPLELLHIDLLAAMLTRASVKILTVSLLMIFPDLRGYSFLMTNSRYKRSSRTLLRKPKINSK